MSRPLTVLFAASEVSPYSKTGGLADVAAALPAALARLGCDVRVISPLYNQLMDARFRTHPLAGDPPVITIGGRPLRFVLRESDHTPGLPHFLFVDQPEFYGRSSIYIDPATGDDYADSDERFAFMARGLLAWLRGSGWRPDIIHLNDWQTAPAAALLRMLRLEDLGFPAIRSVLTIHNLAYQGVFGAERFGVLGLPAHLYYADSPFEFKGRMGFLKAGLVTADRINTVSPTYAQEIQRSAEYGLGLEGVFRRRRDDLTGILNGIDENEWNPATDPHIARTYTAADLTGKQANKIALCRRCGIPEDRAGRPLVGMITRLVDQKGIGLLERASHRLFELDLNMVVLGTGEALYHDLFETWNRRFASRFRAFLTFDETLAHAIEAGADMFLMPSRYEPCGLNQMYSLRYGTVPIVRATGGLRDTVRDCDQDPVEGNGFVFPQYSVPSMIGALRRALAVFEAPDRWQDLRQRGMTADFSWERSARKYGELYETALRS